MAGFTCDSCEHEFDDVEELRREIEELRAELQALEMGYRIPVAE